MMIKTFNSILPSTNTLVSSDYASTPGIEYGKNVSVPESYDCSGKYKLSKIYDQGECGACYAYCVVGMLSDRYRVLTRNKTNPDLSPMDMAVCLLDFQSVEDYNRYMKDEKYRREEHDTMTGSYCLGNTILMAAKSSYIQGVSEESCVPSSSIKEFEKKKDRLPACYEIKSIGPMKCNLTSNHRSSNSKLWFSGQYYKITGDTLEDKVRNIKSDILKFGPIASGFHLYENLLELKNNDIYSSVAGNNLGGHAIRIVGWGSKTVNNSKLEYWIIANSWGTKWCNNGYGNIRIGIKELELEDNAVGIVPDSVSIIPNFESLVTEEDRMIRKLNKQYQSSKST